MADESIDLIELQDSLIEAVLINIPFDGWSQAAIDAGAASLGLDLADAHRCFPNGPADAMAHFSDWADRAMLTAIDDAGEAYASLKIREKIAFGVRSRLEFLTPHKEAVRAMSGVMGRPSNIPTATRLVWKTCDAMWFAAGDTATDFNHYTKRGLLAGVQTSTVLFWLADKSDGHEESWSFLDRRIANVLVIGKRIGQLGNLGKNAPDPSKFAKWSQFFRSGKQDGPAAQDNEAGPTVH